MRISNPRTPQYPEPLWVAARVRRPLAFVLKERKGKLRRGLRHVAYGFEMESKTGRHPTENVLLHVF